MDVVDFDWALLGGEQLDRRVKVITRRLRADQHAQCLCLAIEPGETGFGLHEHRIDHGCFVSMAVNVEIGRFEPFADHIDDCHGFFVRRTRLGRMYGTVDRLREVFIALSGERMNDAGFRLVTGRLG